MGYEKVVNIMINGQIFKTKVETICADCHKPTRSHIVEVGGKKYYQCHSCFLKAKEAVKVEVKGVQEGTVEAHSDVREDNGQGKGEPVRSDLQS